MWLCTIVIRSFRHRFCRSLGLALPQSLHIPLQKHLLDALEHLSQFFPPAIPALHRLKTAIALEQRRKTEAQDASSTAAGDVEGGTGRRWKCPVTTCDFMSSNEKEVEAHALAVHKVSTAPLLVGAAGGAGALILQEVAVAASGAGAAPGEGVGDPSKQDFTVGQVAQDLLSFHGRELCFRPKCLFHGQPGDAHVHVARAMIQALDPTPCFGIDLLALNKDGGGKMEEVLVTKFADAEKRAPCVIFMPNFHTYVEPSAAVPCPRLVAFVLSCFF